MPINLTLHYVFALVFDRFYAIDWSIWVVFLSHFGVSDLEGEIQNLGLARDWMVAVVFLGLCLEMKLVTVVASFIVTGWVVVLTLAAALVFKEVIVGSEHFLELDDIVCVLEAHLHLVISIERYDFVEENLILFKSCLIKTEEVLLQQLTWTLVFECFLLPD